MVGGAVARVGGGGDGMTGVARRARAGVGDGADGGGRVGCRYWHVGG